MSVFLYYFGLPHGQVWPNLAASLVCVGVAWWRLHSQAITHHAELAAQAAIHHAERLALSERHHAEMKAHVAATVTAVPRPAARQPKTLARKPAKEAGA